MTDTIASPDTLLLLRELPVRPQADTTADMQSIVFPRPAPVPSFFTSHKLVPAHKELLPVHNTRTDWIPAVFIISFILLAWLNVYHHSRFRQVMGAVFSKRFMSQLVREGDIFSERITVVLGIVYFMVMPLLGYEAFQLLLKDHISLPFTDIRLYLVFCLALFLFWTLKIIAIRTLGAVFRTPQTTFSYQLNLFINGFFSAVLILPLLIFIVYLRSQELLFFSFFISGMLFIIRFFKGFLIGISLTRFSYFYLFVYLCTLEILPWVIIIRILISYTPGGI